MERIPLGIKGLDDLVQGGAPKGSIVLVSGGTGTCKTIFAMQFAYNGAKHYKEPAVFVTIESGIRNILWDVESFGWDIKAMEDAKLMTIYRMRLDPRKDVPSQIEGELSEISKHVKRIGAKRLVVDSTTAFGVWMKDPGIIRSMLYDFTSKLKELDCTTLLTSETKGGKTEFSAFGVEEFISDAVIALYFSPPNRSIFIRKMRGTDHSKKVHPFQITQAGIEVKSKDEVLWDAIR